MIYCKYCRNKKGCVYAGEDCTREECKDHIPTTNADRIRAMSDEEMAHFINMMWGDGRAFDGWLDWLTKEVGL